MSSKIRVLCTNRGTKLTASATAMGKQVICPRCASKAVVTPLTVRLAGPVATLPLQTLQPSGAATQSAMGATTDQDANLMSQIRRTVALILGLVAFCALAIFGIIWGIDYSAKLEAQRQAERAAELASREAAEKAASAAKAAAEVEAKAKTEAKSKADAEAKAQAEKEKQEAKPAGPMIGDRVVFYGTSFMAVSDSAYEEASRRLIRSGSDGLYDMEAAGDVFIVEGGTKGVLSDSSVFSSKCRIRVTSGRFAGRSGYTWYSSVKKDE